MEKEKEVKVLNIDISNIEIKLISMGAKKISSEFQTNYVFDSNKNIIDDKSYLRIREVKKSNEQFCELTFKKNILNDNIREYDEYTTRIEDKNMMIEILKNLSFEIIALGSKKRISYEFMNANIDIDIWDKNTYPYPYMEIEVKNEYELEYILKKLDIDIKNVTTKSILELKNELKNIL